MSIFLENGISKIQSLLSERKISFSEICDELIFNLDDLNKKYHPFCIFDLNQYKNQCSYLDRQYDKNPPEKFNLLEGMPVGIKDIFNTIDFPTEMGSPIWKNFTPGNDARVVHYLKNSGATIIGKTITAEFAVHHLNETLNPFDIRKTPGTSSSGSAVAVALGLIPFALGSQTAASIIRPASFCGVYAMKPSFGLIPRTGSLKTTDSLDTVGFFTSSPLDLRTGLECCRVKGPNYPFSHKIFSEHKVKSPPFKLAFLEGHLDINFPDYALDSFKKTIVDLSKIRSLNLEKLELPKELQSTHYLHSIIYEKSLSYYFQQEASLLDSISPIMQFLISKGEKITPKSYFSALKEQEIICDIVDNIFQDYDFIICLSTAGSAPLRGNNEIDDYSLIWTTSHLPVVNIPLFNDSNNMPYGLQIIARKYNDLTLLDFVEYLFHNELIPKSPNPIFHKVN